MNIGYFADGPWSHRALDKLFACGDVNIAFICARYDQPDQILKTLAENKNIPFLIHPRINCDDFINSIEHYRCDLFVSMSFNQIFRRRTIDYPPLGTINCHAGKLPFYRGRNILNWALINDETEFGITVHYMDEGIDTGDIILQRCYPITDQDDYGTLLERAYEGCAVLLSESVQLIHAGHIARTPQKEIHPLGFYCSARGPGDECLNWDQTSRDVFNFVRAICPPGPSARSWLGVNEMKINRVEYLRDAPVYKGIPGAVLAVEGGDFLVKTRDSFVRVTHWVCPVKPRVGFRLK